MRLWSIHPRYLDARGLVALWREGLLAQAVLAGRTRGYRRHPQLARFLGAPAPMGRIAQYLRAVRAEAARRGYHFDAARVGRGRAVARLPVTRGQLDYEWAHLARKLAGRAPGWLAGLSGVRRPRPHPSFRVVPGAVAAWESVPGEAAVTTGGRRPRGAR
jgi:hypothetical protein